MLFRGELAIKSRLLTIFLLLWLCCVASAGPYQQLLEQYRSAKTVDEKITVLSSSDLLRKDSSLTDLVTEFDDKPSAKLQTEIQDQLQLRAETEAGMEGKVLSPSAKEITDSPLYSHPQTKEQKNNWLGDALSKIHINFPHFQAPKISAPGAQGLSVLTEFVWVLLAAAVLVFLYFAIRFFSSSKRARRSATTLLEEDEPERSKGEWLLLAEQYEREGQYRLASRCYYIASLLVFDEANVARFDRTETNWQHLRRIQNSPLLNQAVDFLLPTRAFDRIWYGQDSATQQELQPFKSTYSEVSEAYRGGKFRMAG